MMPWLLGSRHALFTSPLPMRPISLRQLAALAIATASIPTALSAQRTPVVIVAQPATTLPRKHAPQPTVPAITAADLMTRLYIFADDSMMGREAGTIGNVKGTNYIAAEVARLGLRPAGDNGTFFQTIPFKRRMMDPSSAITIGTTTLVAGRDWAVFPGVTPSGSIPLVYGGTFGDDSPRLTAAQAAGKMVVYRVLPAGMGALQNPASYPAGMVGVVLLGLDPYIGYLSRPTTILVDPDKPTPSSPYPIVLMTAAAAANAFDAPLAALTPGTAGRTATFDVHMSVEPVDAPTRNVVAILPGSDPSLRGEYIAIGAHNDHLGFNHHPVDHDSIRIYTHVARPSGAEDEQKVATPAQQAEIDSLLAAWRTAHPGTARLDSIYNGADDDGSGSVTALEIAERMAAMPVKPKRSILFVWHVGEEKGLLGSQYFTDHPTVPRDSIVAQLNIDMLGRGDAWDVASITKAGEALHGGTDYLQLIGSRRLSTELGDLVEQVNKAGNHGLRFDYSLDANGHPMNIYCRSDHYEYARYGIPITFFTTGGHSDYHQVADEPQYIDYPHMARAGNLIEQVAERVANLDHRVVVDHPKPDPMGRCQQ
jgi:hypothetical protein